ncbi:hypothetical protein EYF80_022230 [Liparis tanakae]|uniref:Uncharacterized protein n=1 Tax=Liparis tanakae TaxID=230148 RepID=A0A4Z2HP55_9TELE|nr:hypothetical protein EYF80_022230 [Liparis tanakae]
MEQRVFTVCSRRQACNGSVSVSFPLSTYYEAAGAQGFEPCFYLTENASKRKSGLLSTINHVQGEYSARDYGGGQIA